MASEAPAQQTAAAEPPSLVSLLGNLLIPDEREQALFELSKHREQFPELAPTLWFTTGCSAVLLQELVAVYPTLSPPTLQTAPSNRVCNALALIQCIASHPDTRQPFLSAHVPLFLYPFLNTQSTEKPFEYLRLTSLGVIGALVKADEADVVRFLLGTEIVPLCLKIMERGSELSKTVATFIVQKILSHDMGLNYVCATPERFMAVSTVLRTMVGDNCTPRLLRHIIRCYLRLAEHARAKEALKQCLPDQLRNGTFESVLQEDQNMKRWLFNLLVAIDDPGAHHLREVEQGGQPMR